MFHVKTEGGREEIRARQLKLSRSARTLLLILEPSKPTEEWLQMVRGATPDDVQALQSLGLIVPAGTAAAEPAVESDAVEVEIEMPAPPVPEDEVAAPEVVAPFPVAAAHPAPVAASAAGPPALAPASTQSSSVPDLATLTQRCTQLATRHLGLLESYRMVLEIERCSNVAELQALAPRLLSAVERNVGVERAQRLRTELGLDLNAAPR